MPALFRFFQHRHSRARRFGALSVLLALTPITALAAPARVAPSNPAAAACGARDLMARLARINDVPRTLPLLSNRSAALIGLTLAAFSVAANQQGGDPDAGGASPNASGVNPAARKLQADIDAVCRRYGVTPGQSEAQQAAAASGQGRALALALYAVVRRDAPASLKINADRMPPASAYRYDARGPGAVRIRLRNGQDFPGLARPYADAVWEDGQWRLDLGAIPTE